MITKLMEDVQIDWTIRDLKIERVKKKQGGGEVKHNKKYECSKCLK